MRGMGHSLFPFEMAPPSLFRLQKLLELGGRGVGLRRKRGFDDDFSRKKQKRGKRILGLFVIKGEKGSQRNLYRFLHQVTQVRILDLLFQLQFWDHFEISPHAWMRLKDSAEKKK